MDNTEFITTGILRKRDAENAVSRYFLTLQKEVSDVIREKMVGYPKKGWGVKVRARIARMTWETSIFRTKAEQCYMLPIKKEVRKELQLDEGSQVSVVMEIV